ncbi:regulatory protein YycH of two-component signal transduction system YycFG [Melghirimyces profundicolus]|uniref:Regulatory protein YycH of two-component signal transduction system YycFG n=1 Tax=Melghirimyces profundicolus TaxID=1242148 RepID=A0A2T6C289_9BACL|nr:two-component system activity regulator YycH [Melghirimyces profundicolus]PTX62441.1 regulatory protein YycH of two-component signal transduction system YycFG [Melghirimyces profundicolus]
MKEHLKSLTIVFLVAASVVQTGMLWYSSPSYQDSGATDFENIPPIGHDDFQKEDIHQLAAPPEILFHEEGNHRRILPGKEHRVLVDQLHHARLDKPREIEPSPAQWKALMEEENGLELRFHRNLPADVAQTFFRSGEENGFETEDFNRIWIFGEGENNRVTVWMISDQTQTVVQATALIQNYDKVMDLAGRAGGEPLLPYVKGDKPGLKEEDLEGDRVPHVFYLPETNPAVPRLTYELEEIKMDSMKMILFRNPNSVEEIRLSGDNYVYTDTLENGRTLQYNEKHKKMMYYNSASPPEKESTPEEELNTIISFMNRHNGWTGNYLLDGVETDRGNGGSDYDFRLHVKGLPVYGPEQYPGLDTISLTAHQGVTKYGRSLVYFSFRSDTKEADRLPSGKQVLDAVNELGADLTKIRQIYPGYQARTEKTAKKKSLVLKPVWVVVFQDGKQGYLATSESGRDARWTGAEPNPF